MTLRYIDHGQIPFLAIIEEPSSAYKHAVYPDHIIECGDSIIVTDNGEPVTAFNVTRQAFQPEYLKDGYSAFKMDRVLVGSILNPSNPPAPVGERSHLWVVK